MFINRLKNGYVCATIPTNLRITRWFRADCLGNSLLGYRSEQDRRRKGIMKNYTPIELFDELNKTVIGQDQYLMSLCTTLWLHDARIQGSRQIVNSEKRLQKQNLLVVGPTGSGKTLAIQTLANILGYELLIANAPDFTGTGWKGRDVEELIEDLYKQCGRDRRKTAQGIIFLDEIDKIIQGRKDKTEYPTFGVENPLLKLIEGYEVRLNNENVKIDTSNILFIAAGAFEGIEKIIQRRMHGKKSLGFSSGNIWSEKDDEDILLSVKKADLIEYGIGAQFLGRFSRLTSLRELNVTDIKNILLNSNASAVKSMDRLLYESLGVHVLIDESGAEAIAKKAVKEKTGVRGAAFMLQEVMDELLFFLPDEEHVKALSIFEQNGEPAIRYIEGKTDRKESDMKQSIPISVKNPKHIGRYVDYLLGFGENIMSSCTTREMRALHHLLSAIVCYLLERAPKKDRNISSIIKLLESAKRETSNLDEKTVCDILMFEKGGNMEYAKLYQSYRSIYVTNRKLNYAIAACEYFEQHSNDQFVRAY